MRKKEWKYLVTFHTATGAMHMEKYCKAHQLPGRLIPVPRQISAGCGMAWAVPMENRQVIHEILEKERMDVDGEYEILL